MCLLSLGELPLLEAQAAVRWSDDHLGATRGRSRNESQHGATIVVEPTLSYPGFRVLGRDHPERRVAAAIGGPKSRRESRRVL
jgi:hypothetical protein